MNYLGYVIAAYAVFAAVMLWEWLIPHLHIRRLLRTARQREQRQRARTTANPASMELKR